MTALEQYQRLETSGLWRASSDAQRREVTVSFGNATLVISDNAGRALTHWSLPAIEQVSAKDAVTIYAPDSDANETLEIADPIMVEAIETVRRALSRQKSKPGQLRFVSRIAVLAGLAGLAVFWLPDALRNQTLAMVTHSKRTEIGATILGHLQNISGPACRGIQGEQALGRLHRRVFGPDAAGRTVVLPRNDQRSIILPGNIIVIDQAVLRAGDDPAVPAGFLITARATTQHADPLGTVLDHAGLRATMRLLTTGDLPAGVLKSYAAVLGSQQSIAVPTQTLVAAFDAAGVPATSYATVVDDAALLAADPMAGRDATTVLSDGAWVGLQGICDL